MTILLFALSVCLQSPAAGDPLPTFEVASVKPIDTKARNFVDAQALPGGRIRLTSLHLTQLVAAAWMIPVYRVDGPKDINMYGYNVEALPPVDDSTSQSKVEVMRTQFPVVSMLRLRALLIERFNLKYHLESRQHTTYDLIANRGGANLKTAPATNAPILCQPTMITSRGRTIGELALKLGDFYLLTDVRDKTGLTETYEFSFRFEQMFNAPALRDNPLPTLFESIQDSLGLKLVPRKDMVNFVVIDRFDQPAAN